MSCIGSVSELQEQNLIRFCLVYFQSVVRNAESQVLYFVKTTVCGDDA
jgi:hypothetical protein